MNTGQSCAGRWTAKVDSGPSESEPTEQLIDQAKNRSQQLADERSNQVAQVCAWRRRGGRDHRGGGRAADQRGRRVPAGAVVVVVPPPTTTCGTKASG